MTLDEAATTLDDDALVEFLVGRGYRGVDSSPGDEGWSVAIERDLEGTVHEVEQLLVAGKISEDVYRRFFEEMTS